MGKMSPGSTYKAENFATENGSYGYTFIVMYNSESSKRYVKYINFVKCLSLARLYANLYRAKKLL